jgi:hypothetical protein
MKKKFALECKAIGLYKPIAVSAFDLNSFTFLDLLFSVISENTFPLFAAPTFLFIDFT